MLVKKIIIVITILVFTTEFSNSQIQLNLTDNICGNGTKYGVVYSRDSGQVNFGFGFYLFCDVKMELRNLVPPVRMLNTKNGQILLDSCHIFMPFSQAHPKLKYHKYIYEIRPNSGDTSTIALEYGAIDVDYAINPLDSSKNMHKVNSYFITLADEDEFADNYNPSEITELHLFTDSNGNSLYEKKYNEKVVGLRYYCSNNNMEYTRFFIGK